MTAASVIELENNLVKIDITVKWNTPTGALTNPKNFDLNKNLSMNLIQIKTWN